MENKICLVTGANAGIGKTTALGLAGKGAQVVMLCRNATKAEAARTAICQRSGSKKVDLVICDLSSQDSVREAAARVIAQYAHVDALINNAGTFVSQFQTSPEGIELQFAVNHIGHFLLTHQLMPALRSAPSARIVNVSSGSHYGGQINFASFTTAPAGGYSSWRAYSQSKLANILFTYEFARRFPSPTLTANVLHPGVVRTEIGQKSGSLLAKVLWTAFKPFMLTARQGAQTSLHVATSPKLAGVSGKYFEKSRETRSVDHAYDSELAGKLWARSEELCEISF